MELKEIVYAVMIVVIFSVIPTMILLMVVGYTLLNYRPGRYWKNDEL